MPQTDRVVNSLGRADSQSVQRPLAARILETLDARYVRLPQESQVIDVVTRQGPRLNRVRGGNPAKTVEGGRFSR
jgi:hypothetical protein